MRKITLLLLQLLGMSVFAQDLSQNLLLDDRFDGNLDDASPNAYDATGFNIS